MEQGSTASPEETCSFCQRPKSMVKRMVSVKANGAGICNECLVVVTETMLTQEVHVPGNAATELQLAEVTRQLADARAALRDVFERIAPAYQSQPATLTPGE